MACNSALAIYVDEKIPPRQLLRRRQGPVPPHGRHHGRLEPGSRNKFPGLPIMVPNAHGRDYHDCGTSKASIQTALQMAKINLLNKKKRDLFLETLLEARPDLAGLPFVMGDARHCARPICSFPERDGMGWHKEY